MIDDDREIDIESEEDEFDLKRRYVHSMQHYSQAEKRAHHNALERKRRDHIKDSFSSLRDAVPSLRGEKVASRAQILKESAEYIMFMKRRKLAFETENEKIRRQNYLLESQIHSLESALKLGKFPITNCEIKEEVVEEEEEEEVDEEEGEEEDEEASENCIESESESECESESESSSDSEMENNIKYFGNENVYKSEQC